MHPLKGQSDEESLDHWVDAFRGFVEGAKDPDPQSEAVEPSSSTSQFPDR